MLFIIYIKGSFRLHVFSSIMYIFFTPSEVNNLYQFHPHPYLFIVLLLKLSLTHIYAWLRLLCMYVIVFEDDIYNFVNSMPICYMYIAATTFNAEVKETCS